MRQAGGARWHPTDDDGFRTLIEVRRDLANRPAAALRTSDASGHVATITGQSPVCNWRRVQSGEIILDGTEAIVGLAAQVPEVLATSRDSLARHVRPTRRRSSCGRGPER